MKLLLTAVLALGLAPVRAQQTTPPPNPAPATPAAEPLRSPPPAVPLTTPIPTDPHQRAQTSTQTLRRNLRGTESSGGGGVIRLNDKPVLMDFFTIIQSVEELPAAEGIPAEQSRATRAPLVLTEKNMGQIRQSNRGFALAIELLEQWAALPFDTMSYTVMKAMQAPLAWNFVDQSLKAPAFFRAPGLPAGAVTEVAAFYSKGAGSSAEVQIHRPIWNQLELLDQAGLLIHETLRQVQLGYGNGYNDEALQRATAIYLLCRPKGRLNYYMFYVLNNSPERADRIYGSFSTFIQSECDRR